MLVTHGVVLCQRESGRYRVTETRHPAGFALPPHTHDRSALTLVVDGSFTETIEASEWTCTNLSLVFKPAGLAHANHYGPAGATSFIVEFDGSGNDAPLGPGDFTQVLVPLAMAAREGFAHPASTRLAADELTHELVARASRVADLKVTSAPSWLDRVVELLTTSIRRPPGLEELGHEAGVHPVHVSRTFRRHKGVTMTHFVSRCRIAEAVRRLARGASIPATALELGYFDQSHFTNSFRRETGLTPARWRKLSAS